VKKSLCRRASRFALWAVLSLCCWGPTSANAVAGDALPKVVSGEMIRLRGQWMTKSRPAEIQLPGGGAIRIFGNTEASVLTDPQSLMLLPGKKTMTYSVILRRGLIEIDAPNESPPRVAIAVGTPTDVRVVTLSGQSSVKVDGRNVIAVSQSGLTTVTQGSKLARLPNSVKRVYQGRNGFVDRPLLDTTRWVGGRRIWIAASGRSVPVAGYVWSPVRGAAGYLVALRELASQRTVTQSRVSGPQVESFPQPLNPGRYEVDIAGIDSDGFVSCNRTKIPVTVVGVELPGGAIALPKDTVVVAAEQQVKLTYAEGLTLTTADHRSGVPGTEPFGLERLDRAAILIHPPGGGDTSTLTLVRRQPLVSTWVGPKLATWPDDAVLLQVSFVDQQGRPTPQDIEPAVHVLVGVDPVEVEWDKQGSLWQARLPPMRDPGPWVVRLEVVDQYGVVIGRDFAEIARTRVRRRFPELDPKSMVTKPQVAQVGIR
jgi:hypothetical protein